MIERHFLDVLNDAPGGRPKAQEARLLSIPIGQNPNGWPNLKNSPLHNLNRLGVEDLQEFPSLVQGLTRCLSDCDGDHLKRHLFGG